MMNFFDFQIRAWRAGDSHVQVLVHCSPVGDMLSPVTVPYASEQVDAFCQLFVDRWVGRTDLKLQQLVDGGLLLTSILLPPPVYTLLIRSLERIDPEDGLRLRLCLDGDLIDLPWEYVYRPDTSGEPSLAGFLALDSRLCLVRGAPKTVQKLRPPGRKQRLLFAGAQFMVRGEDYWGNSAELRQLSEMLAPLSETLTMESIWTSQDNFESIFTSHIDIFHYSGHTDEQDGRGYLVQDIRTDPPGKPGYLEWEHPSYESTYGCPKLYLDPFYSETLGELLHRAGTRLAVFSACNSGRWCFVEPLLRAGVPAVVGTQGTVLAISAAEFCQKLYSALVLGLSIEEAATWARLHLLEADVTGMEDAWDWGLFMVYMPSSEAVLFPKPRQRGVRERQEAARQARAQTIINVYQNIGTVRGGQVTGVSVGQIVSPQASSKPIPRTVER